MLEPDGSQKGGEPIFIVAPAVLPKIHRVLLR
jgi:hypothetical protein